MRRVNKQTPPPDLAKQKRDCQNDWTKLSGNVRHTWDDQLCQEQMGLDSYTEEKVDLNRDDGHHIDHFRKRDLFPELTFEWTDIFLALHHGSYGADAKDRMVKSADENSTLIHPADDAPEDFFTYLPQGEITPRESLSVVKKQRAVYTIEAFNLNHPGLVEMRHSVIEQVLGIGEQSVELQDYLLSCYPFPSLLETIISEKWWLQC